MKGCQRIVALFDIHIPFHVNLNPVLKFIYDFKPHTIILGGDIHDWTPASHWIANQSLELEGKSILKCYEELHSELFDKLLKAKSKECKIKYLLGNHENWLEQTISLNRNGRGYWEIENNIDSKKYNMDIVKVNMPYRANDNLAYIHGCYVNEYHSKATVNAYHVSVFYGHTHDIQVHIQVSPVDVDKFYKGQSCGCLCTLNPTFRRNKPNKWVNGFHFAYVDDKYFHDTQVLIVNGGFWANNKYYK